MPWTKTATDDVTGVIYPESDAAEIKITVGDVNGSLVIGNATLAALTALANGDATPLRTLLAPATVPTSVRKSGGRRSGGRGKPDGETGVTPDTIRTWARANGFDVPERGKLRNEITTAYANAHPGAAAAAPSEPAATPEPASTATTADPKK